MIPVSHVASASAAPYRVSTLPKTAAAEMMRNTAPIVLIVFNISRAKPFTVSSR